MSAYKRFTMDLERDDYGPRYEIWDVKAGTSADSPAVVMSGVSHEFAEYILKCCNERSASSGKSK